MPDLKHYKSHYSKEDQAEFRRRDRDQKREQQRRVTRWAQMSREYHDVVGKSALMAPDATWKCPESWAHLESAVELEGGFIQPTREFSFKFYS